MQRSKCKNANPKKVETRGFRFSRCPNQGFGFGKMSGLPGLFQSLIVIRGCCSVRRRTSQYPYGNSGRQRFNADVILHFIAQSRWDRWTNDQTNGLYRSRWSWFDVHWLSFGKDGLEKRYPYFLPTNSDFCPSNFGIGRRDVCNLACGI